jgi:hypothetical protein
VIENMSDFRALDPFFRIIEQGLTEFVDGDHFFDLLAHDVVFDFHHHGSELPAPHRRPRQPHRTLPRVRLHAVPRPLLRPASTPLAADVVGGARIFLRGKGRGHRAALQQPIHLRSRHQGPQSHRVARLPRPTAGLRRPRGDAPLNRTPEKRGDDQQATYSVDPLRKLIDGPLLLYGAQTTESQYRISHRARRNQLATSKSQRRVEARRRI